MSEPPNIFMSYSLRGDRSQLVERVNKSLKKLITHELNWKALDPMDDPEAISIERKVRNYLLRSDAIILDNTENPNVAHEAGFAKAFGYPLIVIKCESTSPLPADFGDIEYRSYPDEVNSNDDLEEFLDQIRQVLLKQACRYLVKDFGTSKSPKSTRQRDSHCAPAALRTCRFARPS